MGIEPSNSMHASTVTSTPDAGIGFSAEFAPLLFSEATWSHDASPSPCGTVRSDPRASEQTASLIDMDLWVEPPVAPGSAAVAHAQHHMPIMLGANGLAPEAPHASWSHNTPTNTYTPPTMMPGSPMPNGGQNMQAVLAPGVPEHRNLELVARQIAVMRLSAAIARAESLATADAHGVAIASCNALPLMSTLGTRAKQPPGSCKLNFARMATCLRSLSHTAARATPPLFHRCRQQHR